MSEHEPTQFDVAVIGGGIVGLAVAKTLLEAHDMTLVLLEAEGHLAAHQSSHNSGVIHAGLYYSPNSLKATLCASGREQLYEYCQSHAIAHRRCGKVVVATTDCELQRLDDLYKQAHINGLHRIRRMELDDLSNREPHISALGALFSPDTGVVDFAEVCQAYAADVRAIGGRIHTGSAVHRAESDSQGGWCLRTTRGDYACQYAICCAGLHADRMARLFGVTPRVRIIPFRGEYYELAPQLARLVRHLVYPTPDPAVPFLGVHLTRSVHDRVEVGPNAVLALARHGYSWRDVSMRDCRDIIRDRAFWRLMRHHTSTALREITRSISRRMLARDMRRMLPETKSSDFINRRCGVRAQAVNADGGLVKDFVIQRGEQSLHLLNAPSPAATASLAIAQHIVQEFLTDAPPSNRT